MRYAAPAVSHPRPFRFGVLLETRTGTRTEFVEMLKRSEGSGFSVAMATDHLARWAPLQLLQAAAEATSLRVGALVLNNDFRQPVMLAQELATIDLLSDGRLEIGLGAGWARPEYEAAGMVFERPGLRVDRMIATVGLLKQALADGRIERPADDAYPAMSLAGLPLSVQRPHPPLLIGGGGRRVLSFAAREADIVSLDPRALPDGGHDPRDVTATAIDEKIGWIREAAAERWAQLEINVIVFDVDPDYHRRSSPPPPRTHGITEEELPLSPHYLAGDEPEMIDQLHSRRERWGISYFAVRPGELDAIGPIVSRVAGS